MTSAAQGHLSRTNILTMDAQNYRLALAGPQNPGNVGLSRLVP